MGCDGGGEEGGRWVAEEEDEGEGGGVRAKNAGGRWVWICSEEQSRGKIEKRGAMEDLYTNVQARRRTKEPRARTKRATRRKEKGEGKARRTHECISGCPFEHIRVVPLVPFLVTTTLSE